MPRWPVALLGTTTYKLRVMAGHSIDIAILGGGLAGGVTALALAIARPDLRLLLVERGAGLGGNHVWSFFESDIAKPNRWLTDLLVAAQWSGHAVRFPRFARNLTGGYASITSEKLDEVLRQTLRPEAIMCGAEVAQTTSQGFTLTDGRSFQAGVVIDARGAAGCPHLAGGWQKFIGQMVRLEHPHGVKRPLIMDARVVQRDGFRFVYCLPFSPDTLFIEDTYYSATPKLDRDRLVAGIAEYCQLARWTIAEVLREEMGQLPVVAGGDYAAFRASWTRPGAAPLPTIGVRAGLFNPLTGYSLPKAVEMAVMIAGLPDLSASAITRACEAHASAHWRATGYYRLLARMLFGAASPRQRYKVFARFYTFRQPLIERFYAGRLTLLDQLRVLIGKPPVPIGRALASLFGRGLPLSPLGEISMNTGAKA